MAILILLLVALAVVGGFVGWFAWSVAVIGVVVLLVLWLIGVFNSLVSARNRVKEAWSDIDVQLKRRYDLIPNLIETVKGYAAHESGVLENVIKARSAAMNAQSVGQHAEAENMLSGALKSLFALAEAYPTLRASENFAKLQDELSDTENKIQAARRFYNTNVLALNNKTEQFPTNVVAGMFSFKKAEFFELSEAAAREPVKVSF
ncbi:MAG TPA: LemA family protein [Candidatus Paceibacterota bacterium]|nr:LemA family protein [Candidatus Paceibacterota bacterium]